MLTHKHIHSLTHKHSHNISVPSMGKRLDFISAVGLVSYYFRELRILYSLLYNIFKELCEDIMSVVVGAFFFSFFKLPNIGICICTILYYTVLSVFF